MKFIKLTLFWFLLLLATDALAEFSCTAVTEVPQIECEALVALYDSTDGPNWSDAETNDWLVTDMPCSWTGVTCRGGSIVEIIRDRKQLNGSIPVELGSLAKLKKLYLGSNDLSGNIPPELGNLTNLQELRLYSNQLSGNIPAELGNLINLHELNLFVNQLSGSIPIELADLANLTRLQLNKNQLDGSIPEELSNLSKLRELDLSYNELSGDIPAELGNLVDLYSLSLQDNELSGNIPPELGNLAKLRSLLLFGNQLSGSIPSELGNLTNLRSLILNANQLSGSIPNELANLVNLTGIQLDGNRLTGNIPAWLGNLVHLRTLRLHSNQLSGGIPPELGNLANLNYLYLDSNPLGGSIPIELGNMSSLYYLSLDHSQLRGSIPKEFGNLTNLGYLHLSANQLTGTIPEELGNLSNLKRLWLHSNQLSGSIPAGLGNLVDLSELYLSGNQLSDSIPVELGNLSNLQKLWLYSNQLTGDSPAASMAIWLSGLSEIHIYNNCLSPSDSQIQSILTSKDSDWASTQNKCPANTPPTASNVVISGTLQEDQTVTSTYTYNDADGNTETGSTYQWQHADDAQGTNTTNISGATTQSYTLATADIGKYVMFCVTPTDGTDTGTETCSALVGPVASTVAAGRGTAEDPYQITSCLQLQNINASAYSVLNHDIDCSDTVNWNDGAGFKPISSFRGYLDGQFHQISNLYIKGSFHYMGMIAQASGATIANVQIVDADMTNTSTSLSRDGILAGYLQNYSYVINSASSGTIRGYRVGGLVGRADKSYILSSKSSAEVFSTRGFSGGLLGVLGCDNFGLVKNAYATGTVHNTSNRTGGLVAQAGCIFGYSSPHIENAYYAGSIENGGGFVGHLDTGSAVTYAHIENAFAASNQPTGDAFVDYANAQSSGLNNYWLNTPDNPANPGSLSEPPIAITAVDYFYFGSNEPMASWDASQWYFSSTDYPKLKWESGVCDNDSCPLPTANIAPQINIIRPSGISDFANETYTIQWRDYEPDDKATISFFYDTDNSGEDGILIVNNLTEQGRTGTYSWDTSSIPAGDYYIYAVIDDGVNAPVVDYSVGMVTIFRSDSTTVVGSGIAEDPYQISNCFQLQNMRTQLSAHYILTSDIDCSDTVNWNGGSGFEPIGGNGASYYRGSFDGQNHTISNLYINRSITTEGHHYVGLFGQVGGSLANLTLANVNINGSSDSSTSYVGALTGYMLYNLISNVHVISGKVTSTHIAGGLVGYMLVDEEQGVENSSSAASVTVNLADAEGYAIKIYAGGLVGGVNANCGEVGQGGDIKMSYAIGSVNVNINNSTGINPRIGGLVGTLVDGTCGGDIFNSYSLSSVTVTLNNVTTYYQGLHIGSLSGRAHRDMIDSSYAAGTISYTITGRQPLLQVGGLVGDEHNSSATNSYWDTQITGISTSALGSGKTTTELQNPTSNTGIYSNWDTSLWDFGTASQYPQLRLNQPVVNNPPNVTNVTVSGILQTAQILTGDYLYNDSENDPENGSTYRWQRADNDSGDNTITISDATAQSYTLVSADTGKYVRYCVTPSDGTNNGTEACSEWQLVSTSDTGASRFNLNKAGNGFGSNRVKPTAQTEWSITCRTTCNQPRVSCGYRTDLNCLCQTRVSIYRMAMRQWRKQ